MGLMSHTEVKEIADKKILDVAVEPVKEKEIHLAGTVAGSGSMFAVAHYGSNNMITLRYRLKDLKVQAAEKEFKQGGVTFPAGSFVVIGRRREGAGGGRSARTDRGGAAGARRRCAMHDLDLPRLAIYSMWSGKRRRTSAGCATRSTSSRCRTT